MGHRINYQMFEGTSYSIKTTEQLREAFTKKIEEVDLRIKDRRQRLIKLREDNALSAERLAQLVSLFRRDSSAYITNYNRQNAQDGEPIVPAGVIANIVSEYDMIENEQDQIQRMQLISRNLLDEEPYYNPRTGEHGIRPCIHELTDDELEYLGF
ncbi:MAG: hypothetical protein VYE40_06500 [Myxococcota bacterium]|jgi:hypothetical protein|nr:hypothetical protein [Myxococcota bacterium]